jgi:hypothetical protein
VNAQYAVAVRTEYYARPGRRAIVVSDLASLRGPSRGTVELPLRLYWSGTLPTLPRLPSQKRVTSLITWRCQALLNRAAQITSAKLPVQA